MRVSDLLSKSNEKYRSPVRVEGYLVVSSFITYVVDSEEAERSDVPHRGIIINREQISQINSDRYPLLVGSSVSIVGEIELMGTVTFTGLSLLPMYIPHVYEYSFLHASDKVKSFYKNSETFHDIYIIKPNRLSASVLSEIGKYIADRPASMPLMKRIMSQEITLIDAHIERSKIDEIAKFLEAHEIKFVISDCEIAAGGKP